MSTYEEKEKLPPVRSCFMKAEKTKKEEVCWIRLLLVLVVLINPGKSQMISSKDAVSIKELSPDTAIYLGQINSINSK
ncbi:hypothetical protein FF38_01628 [Lucilia cuprina]|uniref:Uncharacterized protein n=1 Tax=Lucilia cuprina TaxID=7375 RepID=A0A0L0BRG9_LUCCU|nr:hypothetical protein FF38_01628 [Lucilia cuprina]